MATSEEILGSIPPQVLAGLLAEVRDFGHMDQLDRPVKARFTFDSWYNPPHWVARIQTQGTESIQHIHVDQEGVRIGRSHKEILNFPDRLIRTNHVTVILEDSEGQPVAEL